MKKSIIIIRHGETVLNFEKRILGQKDVGLNNNGVFGIPLTSTEKAKIITFLKTLTDNQYLTDKRFSEY